jgi:hypothetical protein
VSARKNTHSPDGLRRFRYLNHRSFNGLGSKRLWKTFCLTPKTTGFPLDVFFSKFDVPLVSETGITVLGGAADAASFV